MAEPTDTKLYNETKMEVDKSYDKPSAYRSMAYSRFYMRAFREKYGNAKKPYKGKKPGDLEKWRRDKWVDVRSYLDVPEDPKQCGTIDYGKKEYPLCMPLSKVKKYSKEDLASFVNQKSKLGKSRLVKESFLNLINEKPLATKDISNIKPENIKVLRPKEDKVKTIKVKEEPSGKVGRPVTVNIAEQRAERKAEMDKRQELKNKIIEDKKALRLAKTELLKTKAENAKLAREAKQALKETSQVVIPKPVKEKVEEPIYDKPKRAVKEKFEFPTPNYPVRVDKQGNIGFDIGF